MVIATYAQNPTSIKKFEYPEYLCPDPYMGKPMRSGSTLLISYSSKSASYGIEFKFGFMKYSLNVSYKGKALEDSMSILDMKLIIWYKQL